MNFPFQPFLHAIRCVLWVHELQLKPNFQTLQPYGSSTMLNCQEGNLFLLSFIAPSENKLVLFLFHLPRRVVVCPGTPWQSLVAPFYVFRSGVFFRFVETMIQSWIFDVIFFPPFARTFKDFCHKFFSCTHVQGGSSQFHASKTTHC